MIEMREDVAALFTDVGLPNMNGVALAKIVSDRWPHIGIVITSGAVPPGVKLELPTNARFLQKPYLPEALLQEIKAVLPSVSGSVALKSLPTMEPGKPHGAGFRSRTNNSKRPQYRHSCFVVTTIPNSSTS
jgi:DNA-binding NtrC family response regulator